MSQDITTKTFSIEQVLAERGPHRHLTNLKFMVSSQGEHVSAAGLKRVAAKLMHAKDNHRLKFSHDMRSIKSENYLIADIVA
ncbi:hypothetical protein [Acetobacter malorum]|uniref:hypothetical protein n=1 Tax=Acetobacter malorum TaxID=178901 RepID=UPI00248D8563|nr:hypothetical protein [Acetobacter malorum]